MMEAMVRRPKLYYDHREDRVEGDGYRLDLWSIRKRWNRQECWSPCPAAYAPDCHSRRKLQRRPQDQVQETSGCVRRAVFREADASIVYALSLLETNILLNLCLKSAPKAYLALQEACGSLSKRMCKRLFEPLSTRLSKRLRSVSEASQKRFRSVSRASHKRLRSVLEVSQKRLRSVSQASHKRLRSASEASQKRFRSVSEAFLNRLRSVSEAS